MRQLRVDVGDVEGGQVEDLGGVKGRGAWDEGFLFFFFFLKDFFESFLVCLKVSCNDEQIQEDRSHASPENLI